MKTTLIGVGQAGGKLALALQSFGRQTGFGTALDAIVVNTVKADLQSFPIGTVLTGQDRVNGHGVGGDNKLGVTVMELDRTEVMSALNGCMTAETESIFVVAGLGGGSGSGGAPILAKALTGVYDVPMYVLGVLPGADEGALYQMNAGRSLKTVTREADAALLVDNDAFRSAGKSMSKGYDAISEAIARRVGLLFAAGEATGGVGESVTDTSEIINTLRLDGIAASGYASTEASPNAENNINAVMSTTRRAVLTGTSLPDASSADATLVVIAGEPGTIPRRGVERVRHWVEDETGSMQVRGGDLPLESGRLASLVLLGDVERSERVESFMERAREAIGKAETEPREDPKGMWHSDDLDDLL